MMCTGSSCFDARGLLAASAAIRRLGQTSATATAFLAALPLPLAQALGGGEDGPGAQVRISTSESGDPAIFAAATSLADGAVALEFTGALGRGAVFRVSAVVRCELPASAEAVLRALAAVLQSELLRLGAPDELGERLAASEQAGALQELALRELLTAEAGDERELLDEIIQAQESMLRQATIPILMVTDGAFVVPLIGTVDPARAGQFATSLLRGIELHRPRSIIIDFTGVPVLDGGSTPLLLQGMRAARLLGAEVLCSGFSPELAAWLIRGEYDLSGFRVCSDLRGAIQRVTGGGEPSRRTR